MLVLALGILRYFSLTAPHAPIVPTTEFIGTSNTNSYGDFVLQVDNVVGQIIESLNDNAIRDNTIIIFTSDNGASPRSDFGGNELALAEHRPNYIFRGHKFDIYEGGSRVPFIISWPNSYNSYNESFTSNRIISTVDIMASVAELIGIPLRNDIGEDSYSFIPILKQQSSIKPLREATVLHSSQGRFAIIKDEWKLILWPGSGGWSYPSTEEELRGLPPFQLFNLKSDPSESRNVVFLYPDKTLELKSLLEKYIQEGRSTPGAPQENDGPTRWKEINWLGT